VNSVNHRNRVTMSKSVSNRCLNYIPYTQAIYFTICWAPRKLPSTNISIDGHPIKWSTEVKYIGATSNKRFTPPSLSKNRRKLSAYSTNFWTWSWDSIHTINSCFTRLALWSDTCRVPQCQLQIIQNKCLKVIMCMTDPMMQWLKYRLLSQNKNHLRLPKAPVSKTKLFSHTVFWYRLTRQNRINSRKMYDQDWLVCKIIHK
jgi:hypothetical protein